MNIRTLYSLLLVTCALWTACGKKEEIPEAKPAPAPAASSSGEVVLPADSPQLKRIRVEEAHNQRVPIEEVVAPGKIETNPNRISRIAMPVAGRVLRVMVGIGDSVQQGQSLFTIESPDVGTATSAYRQAQARLGQARANQTKAEADLSRVQDLFANRAIAQKEVLTAQALLSQAKADVEQGRASTDETFRRLELFGLKPGDDHQQIIVKAPLSGKVLEISVTAGEYRNDTSAPLMTIADLSTVYMAADVPESLIRLVTVGEHVVIALAAYPGEDFQGRVARIADTVDAATRTIRVRVEMKNDRARFRPDMFGEMRHEDNYRDVPMIPAGALIQSDRQTIVYREKRKGVFEPVTITFGKQRGEKVPILTGIAAGERIVTDGAMLLKGAN